MRGESSPLIQIGAQKQADELPDYVDLDKAREGSPDIEEYKYVPAHLGVTAAVNDIFGRVNSDYGFWYVKITNEIIRRGE